MLTSVIPALRSGRVHIGVETARRSDNPVGRAFVAYATVIIAGFTIVATGHHLGVGLDARTVSHLGVVASTVFATAGLLAGHRALVVRDRKAGLIAAVLLGPGAGWCWLAFVEASPLAGRAAGAVIIVANGLAVLLLVEGLRSAHWFGVFSGLGSLALGLTALGFGSGTAVGGGDGVLAILAGVAGMTCLYGFLVDVEVADQRALSALLDSKHRIEKEMDRAEELLHDLRNGLLSIEAAIGSFDGELAGPLRAEAARLRHLTLRGQRRPSSFDLVGVVGDLVGARRAAGAEIELRAPSSVAVWGEPSELLAIVDNLVGNAERHGRPGPILVEIAEDVAGPRLSVTNRGSLSDAHGERLFDRRVTSHPDGEGLGLSRARMLARMNGGELTLAPAKNGYTTFVAELAVRPPPGGSGGGGG